MRLRNPTKRDARAHNVTHRTPATHSTSLPRRQAHQAQTAVVTARAYNARLLVILFTRCKRMTRRQVGSSQKLKSYKENRSRYVPTTLRNPVALVVAVPSKRGNQPATDDRHSRRYFEEGEGKFTQKSPFDTNPAGFAAF